MKEEFVWERDMIVGEGCSCGVWCRRGQKLERMVHLFEYKLHFSSGMKGVFIGESLCMRGSLIWVGWKSCCIQHYPIPQHCIITMLLSGWFGFYCSADNYFFERDHLLLYRVRQLHYYSISILTSLLEITICDKLLGVQAILWLWTVCFWAEVTEISAALTPQSPFPVCHLWRHPAAEKHPNNHWGPNNI